MTTPQFEPTPLYERSEEVQELVTRMPGWMVRRGTIIVLIVVAGFLFFSWEIRYPEIVHASFKLTSANAPKAILARTEGKLEKLFVHDGDKVTKGQTLAYLETTASPREVLRLDTELSAAYNVIKQGRLESLVPRNLGNYSQLGELQPVYQTFAQSLIELKAYLNGDYYSKKKYILENELTEQQAQYASLKKQQQLQQQDKQLAQDEYEADKELAKEKVIAPLELKREESYKIDRSLPYEQTKSALIQNEEQQQAKRDELLELTNQVNQHRTSFIQRLNTLLSAVNEWKSKYVVTAGLTGTVYFPGPLQENQFIADHQRLFYLDPSNSGYFGELYIPQQNFGKVKTGQKVLIKFAGYPFEQYGFVTGKISAIASVPVNDSVYLARVILPDGLTTTFHQKIIYKTGLEASGDIVTEDMRLLERLFYTVRRAVSVK